MPIHYRVPKTLLAMLRQGRRCAVSLAQINALKDFKVSSVDTLIHVFITRHEFTNENSIYFYRVIFITLCTRSGAISLASSRNRLNMLEFITVPVRIRLSNAISMTRQQSPYPASYRTCMNLSRTDSFRLLSRTISDCLLSIDHRGHLARLWSSKDLMNLSRHCSHALYSSIVLSRISLLKSNCAPYCHLTKSFLYQ